MTCVVSKKSLYFNGAFIIMHIVAIFPKSFALREHKEAVSLWQSDCIACRQEILTMLI